MCTYNGERYIQEQLQSIEQNLAQDWKIIVSDDQSTDNTVKILKDFEKKKPGKMIININKAKKGAIHNFLSSIYTIGVEMNDNDFIMLCDQDDVWNADKISKTMHDMREQIVLYGNTIPLLVCTDVSVVDSKMNIIHESFRKMNHYNISHLDFAHLLMENKVQGCTIMINKGMALMLDKLPYSAMMHDGWLAFIAAAFGRIKYIDQPTMKYRQHTANVQGSIAFREDIKNKLSNLGGQRQIVMNTAAQVREFIEIYGDRLSDTIKREAEAFATLPQQNFVMRRYNIIKYHMWKSGLLRNVGLMILI
jgi:glycosyltransferase involved in cell wall biosynthesis